MFAYQSRPSQFREREKKRIDRRILTADFLIRAIFTEGVPFLYILVCGKTNETLQSLNDVAGNGNRKAVKIPKINEKK